MNDTPTWVREIRAAMKAQSRESIARLKTVLGETPEEQDRALAAVLAATMPRKR